MSNKGKIEFCSTKTVWLLSSNLLLAMAYCFSFTKLALTNLNLSSSFIFMVDLDGRTVSTVTLSHSELLRLEKPEQQVRKASHCGSMQQWRPCVTISLIIACSRHVYISVVLRTHSVRGESHIQRNTTGKVATAPILMQVLKSDYKPFPLIARSGLMSCTMKSSAVLGPGTHIFSFS